MTKREFGARFCVSPFKMDPYQPPVALALAVPLLTALVLLACFVATQQFFCNFLLAGDSP